MIILRTVAEDLPIKATTKAGAKPLGRGEEFWTRLHAYEISTGKLNWIAEAGSSVHSLSMIQEIKDGEYAILTGRGGGHQPPEEPYGLSLLRADTGENLWESSIPSYHAIKTLSGTVVSRLRSSEYSIKLSISTPVIYCQIYPCLAM